MLRSSVLFRLFLTLSVLAYSSEGFFVNSLRSDELTKTHRGVSQFHAPPRTTPSRTTRRQASLAPLTDDQGHHRVLERIRSKLPKLRAGAQAEGSLLERYPFLSAVMITTVNALAADMLTQLVFEKAIWNAKRSFLFAAFGFIYQGMAQYAIVNWGWERLLPGTKPGAVIAKICGMNLLSDPILFMPTFYIFREFMVSGSLSWGMVKAALLGYKSNALLDWRNSWMVWFPGHAVTYGVMPTHKRIPWMAFLSFFYMCVLSLTRGGA